MNELKELILLYLNHSKKKLHLRDLNGLINIDKETKRKYLTDALKELELEGKIYKSDGNLYSIAPPNYHIVELLPTSGRSKKFYINNKKYVINASHLKGALDFDQVGVKVYRDGSVKLTSIVKRNSGHVVCVMVTDKKGDLVPKRIDDKLPIKIISKGKKDLVDGNLVKLRINNEPVDGYFEAELVDIIGHKDDPNIEVRAIAASKDIPIEFSEEYKKQLEDMPTELREEDYKDAKDLRDENIFTIDCDTTKDIDDAVGIKKLENGNFLLKVCIVDITHFIKLFSIM